MSVGLDGIDGRTFAFGILAGARWRIWHDCRDLVFLDEHISIVGLHFEHVVFVGHDDAVELFPVLQADFIGERSRNAEKYRGDAGEAKHAGNCGIAHNLSMRPPDNARKTHANERAR